MPFTAGYYTVLILSALWIHGEILTVGTFSCPIQFKEFSVSCLWAVCRESDLDQSELLDLRGFRQFSCLLSLQYPPRICVGYFLYMNGNNPITKTAVSLDALPVFLLFHFFDQYFKDRLFLNTPQLFPSASANAFHNNFKYPITLGKNDSTLLSGFQCTILKGSF